MATIDYKEKYMQALKRAKYYHDRDNIQFLENIFHELAESEDEKIRKAIGYAIGQSTHSDGTLINGVSSEEALAWLEKQKIKEPADKVEQKFKIGDKVLVDGKVYTIKLVNEDNYIVDENGRDVQEHFSYTKDWKLYEQKPTAWSEEDETALGDALWCCKQAASIAKNENDMGNVWYAETWLKNIKDRVQPQPKQEWSEEDKKTINNICHIIRQYDKISKKENQPCWYIGDCLLWMQNIKNKVIPQPKQEWNEKDQKIWEEISDMLWEGYKKTHSEFSWDEIRDWVKPKIEFSKCRVQPQPRQEWSEEEIEKAAQEWDSKANFNPFYMTMNGDKPTDVKQDITTHKESFKAGVNWILKSLRPQSQWKPSEGQLECLGYAIEKAEKDWSPLTNNRIYLTLKALKKQLKKLREEDV